MIHAVQKDIALKARSHEVTIFKSFKADSKPPCPPTFLALHIPKVS